MEITEDFKRLFSKEIEHIWENNKGSRRAVVYLFEDTETDNVYVGTTVNVKERLSNHIHSAKNNKDEGRSWFYNVVRKYGWDRFEFFVLESGLTQKEGLILEKKWVKTLNSFENGYNMTAGGDGASAADSHIFARKVKGVNLDTKEEFHWGWIGGAAEHLGVGSANINKILRGNNKNKQTYNWDKTERYIFKYEEDETPWDFTISPWEVPIVLRNVDTKEIHTFASIADASRYINAERTNIHAVLGGRQNQIYSRDTGDRYEVQYHPTERAWKNDIPRWEDKCDKPINAYIDGVFFSWYKSAAEAGRVLKINKNSITQTALHNQNGTRGYTFEYADPILREKQPPRPKDKEPKVAVFYIKNGEKISFVSVSAAVRATIDVYSRSQRTAHIQESIKLKKPDYQGIQWFKS